MFLEITGFLVDDSEDESIKFELDVNPKYEQAVMGVLGWISLETEAAGELLLTITQVQQIAVVIEEQLPADLELFIGVRA